MNDRAKAALRPEHPVARPLSQFAHDFELGDLPGLDGVEVTGVSINSRDVEPGDLYVGLAGAHSHGATFATNAREAGAVAVLTDEAGVEMATASGLPVIHVANPRAALGDVAAWVYRTSENPATLFAVTGTNGKTSAVYILNALLTQLGVQSGLSSTAERRIGPIAVTSLLTTPEASEMHALLARMRESAVRAVAIEVSAQAVSRHRIDGLLFDVVGFTNLSHDHLDDYSTMREYFEAKLQLFQPDRARRGVVMVDSEWGRTMAEESRIPVTRIQTSPDGDAEWTVTITDQTPYSTSFLLEGPEKRRLATSVPLVGAFMAHNAAVAIVMLVESGFDLAAIEHALGRDGEIKAFIPGRAERVSGQSGPIVYVDYGHTPAAFQSTLQAIRQVVPGKLIMVFGADGDRDTSKRLDMGAIAAREADAVVICDFHPRFEDPDTIRAQLVAGARAEKPEGELYEIADPRQAFRKALSLAGAGDAVLYAGPGHEDYREVAGVRLPYSARDDVRLALMEAGWPPND
ncbi:Mur ligase family protein [Homoserinimonas sp. OAct 916]|uniref:Mur ligase family protein n=1 Tax=Homoserinimonas sp. OAct 916 TaxID=2211450 RepID=UPI000DBE0134|nr:UDP-N-acetylmuramoyl-L-alanyl-D-glutamate--2,6-diaminopimelate ligase [Homoserinimonas sp. OAct 916]